MPQPERLQEYWTTNPIHFYNHFVASKELFASIRCPVLVMAGERDTNAPLTTAIAAYPMLPNSQLSIILMFATGISPPANQFAHCC